MEAHVRNIWIPGFLPEYVWCPGCEQHLSFCVYVNTWLVLCTCVIHSDSVCVCVCVCMCGRYVLKGFMSATFENCEMVLTYCGLRHLARYCSQTNVLPHWLVTTTMKFIPLCHKMSFYEGIISDILTVCWFLISLPFSTTQVILQRTIHLLCWWIV